MLAYLLWLSVLSSFRCCMIFYYGLTDRSGSLYPGKCRCHLHPGACESTDGCPWCFPWSAQSSVCVLAYPLAMILRRRGMSASSSFIVLIFILPMWMNFLLRTLAWQTLLEKNGVINSVSCPFSHLPTLEYHQYPRRHYPRHGIQLPAVHGACPFIMC